MLRQMQFSNSFGHSYEKGKVAAWEKEYVRYKNFKALIESPEFDGNDFAKQLGNELDRVGESVSRRIADIVTQLKALELCPESSLLDKASQAIENVDTLVGQNLQAFQMILLKCTERGLSNASFQSRLGKSRLKKAQDAIHCLIVQLSEIYTALNNDPESIGKVWKPPDSFSRKTTKYWVRPEHMTKLKLFVTRHLPILEVSRSPKVSHEFQNQDLDQTHNFISSIYFDNDQLGCYHRRIQAEEGARLLRLRWYGGTRADDSKLPFPTDEKVFVEMKTHHESWVQIDSTKERFPLTRQLLPAFFNSTKTPQHVLQEMVTQGVLTEIEAAKHEKLAEEVQSFVREEELRPLLRTFYHRTAFQSSSDNAVRISFDMPCFFFLDEEKEMHQQWASFKNFRERQEGVEPFPYGVFEVKISGETTPQWVEQLLATGWLEKVEKFSKFQTTVATNLQSKCSIFPHWIDHIQPTNLPPPSVASSEEGNFSPYASTTHWLDRSVPEVPASGATSPVRASSVYRRDLGDGANSPVRASSVYRFSFENAAATGQLPCENLSSTLKDRARVFCRNVSSSGVSRSLSAVEKRTNLVRTKVEPKTYFANERTFIQWLSASVLLVTLAVAVMTLNDTARLVGTIFVPVALIFMLYSLGLYQWRLRKIIARDGSRFDDPYGPVVLTLVLCLAMVATVAVLWLQESAPIAAVENKAQLPPLEFVESRHKRCNPLSTRVERQTVASDTFLVHEQLDPQLCESPASCHKGVEALQGRIEHFYQVRDLDVIWDETEEVFCVPQVDPDCSQHRILRQWATAIEPAAITIVNRNVNSSFIPPVVPARPGMVPRSKWESVASCTEHVLTHRVTLATPDDPVATQHFFPQPTPARTVEFKTVAGTQSPFEVSGGAWHPGWQLMVLVGDGGGGMLYIGDFNGGQSWAVAGDLEGAAVADPSSPLLYLLNEDDGSILEWSRESETVTRRFDLLSASAVPETGGQALTDADRDALVDAGVYNVGLDEYGAEGLAFVPDENDAEGGVFWVGSQENSLIYRFRLSLKSGGSRVQYLGTYGPWPEAPSEISSLEYDWECEVVLAMLAKDQSMLVLNRDGTARLTYTEMPGTNQEAVVANSKAHTFWFGEDSTDLVKEYHLSAHDAEDPVCPYSTALLDAAKPAGEREWERGNDVNALLGTRMYPPDAPVLLQETRHNIRYRYEVRLAKVDTEVSWVVTYGSEEERALMKNPVAVSVEVRMKQAPSLGGLRQAEGLLELLGRPGRGVHGGMSPGTTALLVLAIASPVVLAVLFVAVSVLVRFARARWIAREEATGEARAGDEVLSTIFVDSKGSKNDLAGASGLNSRRT